MDFNELTTISGAVVFIKRPAPWNWQAIDDKGVKTFINIPDTKIVSIAINEK